MASKLVVLEKGQDHKTKVVLLHGFPFDKSMWKGQVDALSSKVRGFCISTI